MSKDYHSASFTEVPDADDDSEPEFSAEEILTDTEQAVALTGAFSSVMVAVFMSSPEAPLNLTLSTGAGVIAAPAAVIYSLYAVYSVVARNLDL